MALTELVSNLAAGLYGAPTPSQFVMPIGPGSSNTPTDAVTFATTNNGSLFYIQNSGNGISRRIAQGFNNLGYLAFFGNKQSKDFFPLFTALGESGTSRRMNQGGYGFPFPIGPTGNVYDWKPNAHTGWNINNRYNDTTNKTSTIGLADTYTTNSPIDDIYNKVKVRSAAWNKNSFGLATDQPFILRGIQRDNNSDPQYWGAFNNPNMNVDTISDTPRGGLLTAIEREAIDKARIGKFLISPKGIFFAVKQLGLQASNPNVEGFTGTPSYNPIFNTKLWNPLSLFSLNTPVPYHITRHGIPGDPTGLSAYGYEKTVTKFRRASPFAAGADPLVVHNRLVKLESEAFGTGISIGGSYNTLGGFPNPLGSQPAVPYIGGPKSFLGLGFTNQRRYTNTSLKQSSLLLGSPGLNFVTNPLSLSPTNNLYIGSTYDFARYKDGNTYTKQDSPLTDENEAAWSREGRAKIRGILEDPFTTPPFPKNSKVLGNNAGTDNKGSIYSTLAYGNLDYSKKTGAVKNYNDFRDDIPARIFVSRENTYTIDATKVKYAENNIAKKYGIPEYGAAGLDRSDPTKAAVTAGDTYGTATGTTDDLIEFSLGLGSNKALRFRAYINSVSNNWNVNSEDGTRTSITQIVKSKIFKGIDHSISVDFAIPILSLAEHTVAMAKLDTLAKLTYGQPAGGNSKRFVNIDPLKIGKFIKTRAIINSLSYDIDNETSWDIDNQTPMLVQASITFTEIDNPGVPITATNNNPVIYHP